MLTVGIDWQEFHTPPYAGGLINQPIQLMKEIRLALMTYNTINAYRIAQSRLSDEGFIKLCNANPDIMKFMELVWRLQKGKEENTYAPDG